MQISITPVRRPARPPRRLFWVLPLLASAALLTCPNLSPAAPVTMANVTAELLSEQETIRPGGTFTVGIALRPSPGWHTYWQNPGTTGLPTKVNWKLPKGFQAEELQWPHPVRLGEPPFVAYGYEGDALLLAEITAPSSLTAGEEVEVVAATQWLTCREDACIPGKAELPLKIRVEKSQPLRDSRWGEAFDAAHRDVPRQLEGWSATIAHSGDDVRIEVTAPLSAKPSTTGIEVFPLVGNLINASGETSVRATDTGFLVELDGIDDGDPIPASVGLVLVAEGGWDAEGKLRALRVDARSVDAPFVEAQAVAKPDVAAHEAAASGQIAQADAGLTPQPPNQNVPAPSTIAPSTTTNSEAATDVTLVAAIVLAFLGGLVLNLMPCVFPVLSLKILGFVHVAHHQPVIVRRHGYAFAGGVLVSFWILAGLLIALRAAGGAFGWGFQLQEPFFVAGMAALLLAMSLNLLGVFEIGGSMASKVGSLDTHLGYRGSFLSGVLATILATPCSGPFMGTALGFALAQPAIDSLAVFTALGLGMAAPYLILACVPALMARLPRPGAWMERFRHAMAIPLIATVAWLVWVFRQQTSDEAVLRLMLALTLGSASAWIWGRASSAGKRGTARIVSGLLVAGAITLVVTTDSHIDEADSDPAAIVESNGVTWLPWDPGTIADHRREGRVVFVDFTADWCLSCKVNERVALGGEGFAQMLRENGAVAMKADWTRADPRITEALASFDRSGVPLYVVYPIDASRDPIVLPQVLTPSIVSEALARAQS